MNWLDWYIDVIGAILLTCVGILLLIVTGSIVGMVLR